MGGKLTKSKSTTNLEKSNGQSSKIEVIEKKSKKKQLPKNRVDKSTNTENYFLTTSPESEQLVGERAVSEKDIQQLRDACLRKIDLPMESIINQEECRTSSSIVVEQQQ